VLSYCYLLYNIEKKLNDLGRQKHFSMPSYHIRFGIEYIFHIPLCRKRQLNGAVLRMRPEKSSPRVTADDPSLLKDAEHRLKFCSPSPAMVTSLYKWNILQRDVKPQRMWISGGYIIMLIWMFDDILFRVSQLAFEYHFLLSSTCKDPG
jgi:hypothetical protein